MMAVTVSKSSSRQSRHILRKATTDDFLDAVTIFVRRSRGGERGRREEEGDGKTGSHEELDDHAEESGERVEVGGTR